MVDEVIQEFLLETREILDVLDNELVNLEERGAEKALLDSIFRGVHTVKGTCGFLELSKMEKVAHVGEGLLSKLRDGELSATSEVVDALLAMGDALRQMLDAVENTGTDGEKDWTDLVATLQRLRDGGVAPRPAAPAPPPPAPAVPPPAPAEGAGVVVASGDSQGRGIAVLFGAATPLAPATSAAPSGPGAAPAVAPTAAPPAPAAVAGSAKRSDEDEDDHDVETSAKGSADSARKKAGGDNIRVDVALLDKLMNLVGELVLARNQVLQFANDTWQDATFVATSQRLNLITMELQEGVMKTRMQPINNIWGKFPRMVRHLASVCGKKVRMEMEGQDTELDRTILEAIKDPLTHIIRNSVDHGIEDPETRVRSGKKGEGLLFLRAYHESGQVNMEISDDGKGIDIDKVRARAIERALISAADGARLTDREIMQFIFHPGFSTAATVTNVSGRGVGMDVVKTNIERIGGTVDIQSERGKGTTLKIKIPLTLAIIPTLIVQSGAERFAVPQVSLVELVRLDGPRSLQKIEHIHGAPVYRLRGNLLPLVYLNDVLSLRGATSREAVLRAAKDGQDLSINIVILQAYERQFGLVVDAIQDTAEIVVKPLGALLKGLGTFAGATILGDGRVALILDVLGLAQASKVLSEHRGQARQQVVEEDRSAGQTTQLLLFRCGQDRRLAIPLDSISRLEEFEPGRVELAGSQEVVQYRGSILPLLRMSRALGIPVSGGASDEPLQVLVYADGPTQVGLIVEEIVDVVEEAIVVHRKKGGRGGVVGSAVIGGKVTDIVDIAAVVQGSGVTLFESDLATA
jgi:two-component system chemotaxis sensor kinase CheA